LERVWAGGSERFQPLLHSNPREAEK